MVAGMCRSYHLLVHLEPLAHDAYGGKMGKMRGTDLSFQVFAWWPNRVGAE